MKICPQQAALDAIKENLQAPVPDPNGTVETLNNKGVMAPKLDEVSKAFVEFAALDNVKVLEIGSAYGLACIEALNKGAKDYTANDLDIRHLKILAKTLKATDSSFLTNLKLIHGSILDKLNLPSSYYDAILIARVLHFMKPDELQCALKALYKTLKPGGKIYGVMLTPYVKGFRSFIPEFERRVKENESFPGYVEDLLEIVDKSFIPEKMIEQMKKHFLFFDTGTARRAFEQNGFIIEGCKYTAFTYASDWQLDGKENIGIIAQKPL